MKKEVSYVAKGIKAEGCAVNLRDPKYLWRRITWKSKTTNTPSQGTTFVE